MFALKAISNTLIFIFFLNSCVLAQSATLKGKVIADGNPIEFANVFIAGTSMGSVTNANGEYFIKNVHLGDYSLQVACIGFSKVIQQISVNETITSVYNFDLSNFHKTLSEVVISGTLKEVSRLESPVPVQVYSSIYFKKNPTPNIYDALQNVNGIRPQLNCNICNTGDIHINGLEGPYTMVLIDGMPIVSSLSTVYGLSGIPNSMVERIEIVKGPASSLYGSEAVGGLINIITKKANSSPIISFDDFATSWQESNNDLSFKLNVAKKATVLTGINYFNFNKKVDNNHDNFTDMTLQDRISIFQKWSIERKENRVLNFATRYMYEDRWGGDIRWNDTYRGGNQVYGESIYTSRWEAFGTYQLPFKEKLILSFSFNSHNQNSVYGTTIYKAVQNIGFAQLTWDKNISKHDFLLGIAYRNTFYDDNTPATASYGVSKRINNPQITLLPGVFVQDEISLQKKHKLLLGYRYDYNSYHGSINTPRIAYKYTMNSNATIRLNAGTGYRIVNLFTEDHAALTGARIVEIKNELNPEKSYNANLNFIQKIEIQNVANIELEVTAFYTHFRNRIVGDYDLEPNKIIYDNLNGYAESKGISLNVDASFTNGIKLSMGSTLMQNSITKNRVTTQQILTENFTGVWAVSYKIQKLQLSFDYSGNVYSPMRLPLLGALDPRKANSPWWSIQNIQATYSKLKHIEIYGGVKNLLNWTPNKGNPFIIARANDPFDKGVKYNTAGQVIATPTNPYALTFDPNYMYGPNQGLRFFFGVRYKFSK